MIVIDVFGDPGTSIGEIILAKSMRSSLKAVASQAKLGHEMTTT
jgi:hypothetical protein